MCNPAPEVVPPSGPIAFTPKIRRLFRQKRQSLCLDYAHLGAILNLHWTTVRNWETGRVSRCHPKHLRRLRDFLSGHLDERILQQQNIAHHKRLSSDRTLYQILLAYQQINLKYLHHLGCSSPHKAKSFFDAITEILQKP